jgi:hypothetical protein
LARNSTRFFITLNARGGTDAQDPPQLLTDGETLLLAGNHTGVFAATTYPFCMEPIEIGDVERVEDASMFRGLGQVHVIGFLHQAGVRGRNHRDITGPKRFDKSALYSVLVDIDLEKLHGRSAPVLLCERVVLTLLGFQIGVDLGFEIRLPISVTVAIVFKYSAHAVVRLGLGLHIST